MNKILLPLLILLLIFFSAGIYFLDTRYFLSPVEYKGAMPVRFDSRGDGFFGAQRNGNRAHEGLDLLSPIGTPVLAARSGWVIEAGLHKGYGNYVIMLHPQNLTTIYAHLSKIYVRSGQYARQGQIIGAVGKSGNANHQSIQPHLHFEVRINDVPQDPMGYLN